MVKKRKALQALESLSSFVSRPLVSAPKSFVSSDSTLGAVAPVEFASIPPASTDDETDSVAKMQVEAD